MLPKVVLSVYMLPFVKLFNPLQSTLKLGTPLVYIIIGRFQFAVGLKDFLLVILWYDKVPQIPLHLRFVDLKEGTPAIAIYSLRSSSAIQPRLAIVALMNPGLCLADAAPDYP